jgi:hypothetical protein
VILDRVGTAAIEGATDETWFVAVIYRRADAAAVNAIARGSQHSTIRAISHRIARSLSVSARGHPLPAGHGLGA